MTYMESSLSGWSAITNALKSDDPTLKANRVCCLFTSLKLRNLSSQNTLECTSQCLSWEFIPNCHHIGYQWADVLVTFLIKNYFISQGLYSLTNRKTEKMKLPRRKMILHSRVFNSKLFRFEITLLSTNIYTSCFTKYLYLKKSNACVNFEPLEVLTTMGQCKPRRDKTKLSMVFKVKELELVS